MLAVPFAANAASPLALAPFAGTYRAAGACRINGIPVQSLAITTDGQRSIGVNFSGNDGSSFGGMPVHGASYTNGARTTVNRAYTINTSIRASGRGILANDGDGSTDYLEILPGGRLLTRSNGGAACRFQRNAYGSADLLAPVRESSLEPEAETVPSDDVNSAL